MTTPLSTNRLSTSSRSLPQRHHTQRQSAVSTLSTSAKHHNQLADDVFFFESEARKYREATNLEQALSHTLLQGMTLQHLLIHTKANTKAHANYKQKLHETEHALGQLHSKLQSKMDYFHGCLDSGSDDDVEEASPNKAPKLYCDSIQPIDVSSNNVSLASIVGNDAIKRDIITGIVQPFNQPLLFKMHRSFLFYGPPGTGKTMFAKASANSLHTLSPNMNVLFFAPSTDQLKDKHVGGTEKKITNYFRCVQQHAETQTKETGVKTVGIIFIDEIDSLARSRDEDDSAGVQASATNTLLQMMDGFTRLNDVIVMAATNYPWQLDDAVLSRFQDKIYVRLPDTPTIIGLLKYNIGQFYTHALHIAPNNVSPQLVDVLLSICGIEDNVLTVLAKSFHKPTTYSPSNIKDVCQQVFRKSARQVHQHGVFYPVSVSTGSAVYHDLSKTEKIIIDHINHKHCSATTFERLRAYYPDLFAETTPIHLQPSQQQIHTRPETITVDGVEYIHCALWQTPDSSSINVSNEWLTFVQTINRLTQYHIYIPTDAHSNNTATQKYIMYKPFYTLYGAESISVFQMCGVGEWSRTDRLFLKHYIQSPLSMVQPFIEPLLTHTPTSLLLRRLTRLLFKDTKTITKHTHGFWSVDVHSRRTIRKELFDVSCCNNADTALVLQDIPAHTQSGAERLTLWSVGASHTKTKLERQREKQLLHKLQCHKLDNKTSDATIQLHYLQDGTRQKNTHTQRNAFSLHIEMQAFADAKNTDFQDAVRPTTSQKEVKQLDDYARGAT